MRGAAHLTIARRGARSVAVDQRCEPPFSLRPTPDRMLIAASAASPVGGDELSLCLDVHCNAIARVGSVGASIVLPGPTPERSTMSTRCDIGANAHLDWRCQPTVSVWGSDHLASTIIRLDDTATCTFVEELALGRSGEASGALEQVIRIERGGSVLLHHSERFGPEVPGAGSSVSVGDARHVLTAVFVGLDPGNPRTTFDEARGAWMPITDDAAVLIVLGRDRPSALAVASDLAEGALGR